MTFAFENTGSQRSPSWQAVLGLFAALWLLPPVIHDALHLCPLRPDGVSSASAMPTYSRKYGMSCNQCHAAFPVLNSFGREFKLNGYVPETEDADSVLQSADKSLWTEKIFPWGALVKSRPFDNSSNTDSGSKLQAIQSVTLWFSGGDVSKHVSWFGEMDADADGGFTPSFGELQLGYHPSPYYNFIVARRGFYVMDPYQTLAGIGNPTIANRAVSGGQLDQGSLSMDTLDEMKHTLMVYGQALQPGLGALYYAAGVSADKNDDKGRGQKDGNVRLAFDTLKGLVIGTFGSFGHEGPGVVTGAMAGPADNILFSRTGVDAVAEFGGFIGRSAFLYAYDQDRTNSSAEINRAAYAELMYVFTRAGNPAPFLVPLVRENWYQTTNGTREFSYVTAQLAHYFTSNVKAFIEYSGDTKQDITSTSGGNRAPKNSRWTLQAEVGF